MLRHAKPKEVEGTIHEVWPEIDEDQEDVIVNSVEQLRRQKRNSDRVCDTMKVQKCILLGNSGVGKTSILHRHDGGGFTKRESITVGAGYKTSYIDVGDTRVVLQIWDTAGQEQYKSMVPIYLRNSRGIFLVYDVTDKYSFRELPRWIELVGRSLYLDEISLVLVANKVDKEAEGKRAISEEEGRNFAEKTGFHYMETSAFMDEGVEDLIEYMAKQIFLRFGPRKAPEPEPEQFTLQVDGRRPSRKCCTIL